MSRSVHLASQLRRGGFIALTVVFVIGFSLSVFYAHESNPGAPSHRPLPKASDIPVFPGSDVSGESLRDVVSVAAVVKREHEEGDSSSSPQRRQQQQAGIPRHTTMTSFQQQDEGRSGGGDEVAVAAVPLPLPLPPPKLLALPQPAVPSAVLPSLRRSTATPPVISQSFSSSLMPSSSSSSPLAGLLHVRRPLPFLTPHTATATANKPLLTQHQPSAPTGMAGDVPAVSAVESTAGVQAGAVNAEEMRPHSTAAAAERRAANTVCGNMPRAMMPNFTYQHNTRKKTDRRMPPKSGYVGVSGLYNKGPGVRTRTENGPRPTRVESTRSAVVRGEAEQALVHCLEDLSKCTPQAAAAAQALKPLQKAVLSPVMGVKGRFRTCAIVGNSGAMLEQEYGKYIDSHDRVMRINLLENHKYSKNLGTAAHFRVLSYKMSKDMCCIMPKEKHPPDNDHLMYLIWFPARREELAAILRKRYPNPVKVLSNEFLDTAVSSFKGMRSELVRLGFGPFEDWEFITSGMHGTLALLRSCDSVNLFGFTTDITTKHKYWFTGRNVAPRSGKTQHAWDHERMILRLLYAAGVVNICTT